jgi:hypothetical protein
MLINIFSHFGHFIQPSQLVDLVILVLSNNYFSQKHDRAFGINDWFDLTKDNIVLCLF